MLQEIEENTGLPDPTEFLEKILTTVERLESINPEQMEETTSFWTSPLGERFTWAITGDRRKIMTCKHVSLSRPTVYMVSFFRPNKVDCIQCGFKRLIRHNDENPNTCDGCGETDIYDFEVVSYQAGVFIITGKVCKTCYDKQPVQEGLELPEERLEPEEEPDNETNDDQ